MEPFRRKLRSVSTSRTDVKQKWRDKSTSPSRETSSSAFVTKKVTKESLKDLLSLAPGKLSYILMSPRSRITDVINEDLSDEQAAAVIYRFSSALRSCIYQSKRPDLLNVFLQSRYFVQVTLPTFASNVCSVWTDDNALQAGQKILGELVWIMLQCQDCLPVSSHEKLEMLRAQVLKTHGLLKKKFRTAYHCVAECDIQRMATAENPMITKPDAPKHSEQPPNSFRELTEIPTVQEILSNEKPFLRKNLTDMEYDDVEHYLDVQFRLLREDMVRPFREAVTEYKSRTKHPSIELKLDKGRLYLNAMVCGESYTFEGAVTHLIIPVFPKVDWNTTKRLQPGAMLALSPDHFQSLMFVTVVNRQPYQPRACLLKVKVQQATDGLSAGIKYNILETDAYFEGYRQVLKTLKTINVDRLPLSDNIVKLNAEKCAPKYLTLRTQYQIPVINPKTSRTVPILKQQSWPSAEELGLNELQRQALQLALTQKLALIQGPPGTGKTHLGMIIMKSLLMNKEKISPEAPFLVLAYTNHALDQFLEGIEAFTKKFIRVGSRSSSEVIKPHVLSSIRKVGNTLLKISRLNRQGETCEGLPELSAFEIATEAVVTELTNSVHQLPSSEHAKLAFRLFALIKQISQLQRLKVRAEMQLLTKEDLKQFMTVVQYRSLVSAGRTTDDEEQLGERHCSQLARWLCLTPDSVKFYEYQTVIDGLGIPQTLQGIPLVPVEVKQKHSEGIQLHWNDEPGTLLFLFLLQSNDIMSRPEARAITNVTRMTLKDRWRLYRYWRRLALEVTRLSLCNHEEFFKDELNEYELAKCSAEASYAQRADVLGMTTTGAAKNRYLLEMARPVVALVEEAAEVVEGHIVASLVPSVRHVILIGDHKQLRPTPTVYELGIKYQLDISLFERLFRNHFPCVTLSIQHRMRPCMAELLVPDIYSELSHAKSVTTYPNVAGMEANMFFLDHSKLEEEADDLHSHSNVHEALFVSHLALYLLQQGYAPERITILTTYVGQLVQLKKYLTETEGIRICTVDNFQGEENDIILLSLVRSNTDGKIGFLKIENRVCVALSRARHGFFVIGNLSFLSHHSVLWSSLVKKLKKQKAIGTSLKLRCEFHPNQVTMVSEAKDFKRVPEGGCSLPCEARLDCGHSCARHCHPDDRSHSNYQCKRKCGRRLCPKGHDSVCRRKCFEECEKCPVLVEQTMHGCGHKITVRCGEDSKNRDCTAKVSKVLLCGHKAEVLCCQEIYDYDCRVECSRTLICGHDVVLPCHDIWKNYLCKVQVKRMLKCRHTVQISCHEVSTRDTIICKAIVTKSLKCGHVAQVVCSATTANCNLQSASSPVAVCTESCGKSLPCGHVCTDTCGTSPCSICEKNCRFTCSHGGCPNVCGEPCVLCTEPCQWFCEHKSCSRSCHEPCNRTPCDKPCSIPLPCGHPCLGFCGEPCPPLCKQCQRDRFPARQPIGKFVLLEDCKHAIEVNKLRTHFERESIPSCPVCGQLAPRNYHFGHVIKTWLNHEHQRKIKNLPAAHVDASTSDTLLENIISRLNRADLNRNDQLFGRVWD